MKDGFIKVSALTPKITVADTESNAKEIIKLMKESAKAGCKVTVFPELCITGYTCGDLFLQRTLLENAKKELVNIAKASAKLDGIFFVGLPVSVNGKLYNVAAAVSGGEILGLVPKINIPNYNEFYEARYFASGREADILVPFKINGETEYVNLSSDVLFTCENLPELKIGVEICEDLWVPNPPSVELAYKGATVIVNLSASNELTGKSKYRRNLVISQSARLVCGYIYASAGDGESTQDVVYSGHNLIAENGRLLSEAKPFGDGVSITELDLFSIEADRRRMTTYSNEACDPNSVEFSLKECETNLTYTINKYPFVPGNMDDRNFRCDEILTIQASGLKKRLEHTQCKNVVIGISGGLDSTLALLVTVKAFDMLKLDRKGIIAVTMPGFGTTSRTYDNALNLVKTLKATLKEINIKGSVLKHFADIDHDVNVCDITYENSQARERTQILMDLANKVSGMVIGTGDLSELALGWATYNGDHMSMYGVNASVPKTLVRHLVNYYADTCNNKTLKKTLLDVLSTPVSPELLPPKDGDISQKTEDIVGPYELHDFFLYNMLRKEFGPKKIYRLALIAFKDDYDSETIYKWLKTFYRRFFAQQFKRSCLPDGPKVGSVAVSPRGDLRMPSDASAKIWMNEIESI